MSTDTAPTDGADEPTPQPLPLSLDRKPPRETNVILGDIHLALIYRDRTEMVPTIRACGGLLQPVLLSEAPAPKYGHRYVVAAGRRRVAALYAIAREDGVDPATVRVPAKVYAGLTAKELAIVTLQEANRDDNHLSHVEACERLVRAGLSEKQIADGLRWTPRRVKNYIALRGLEVPLQKALGRGDMTLRACLEALKLPTAQRAALVKMATGGGRVSIEAVRERLPVPQRLLDPDGGEREALVAIVRRLREALYYYAKPDVGWAETEHADVYEESRELVPDAPSPTDREDQTDGTE